MAITQAQLADKIEQAFDSHSNLPDLDPELARREIAEDLASAIAQFVQTRETVVTGTSATGGAVTGTGIIQ